MAFQFTTYDSHTLAIAGKAFCVDASKELERAGSKAWTVFVLEWFAKACQASHTVWPPSPQSPRGEFLVDQCHVTFPGQQASETWLEWYDRVLTTQGGLSLALESEWGKRGALPLSVERMLDDAFKLAAVRAKVKVMVFGSLDGGQQSDFVRRLRLLRRSLEDPAPWLWIDVPWRAPSGGVWKPDCDLLG